jgi:hypothetical protein
MANNNNIIGVNNININNEKQWRNNNNGVMWRNK